MNEGIPMIDIIDKPYFCYNSQIDQLMSPIQSIIDIKLDCVIRKFVNDERFIISTNKEESISFISEKLYRYGIFEKKHKIVSSTFQMWDALINPPPQIYQRKSIKYNMAHGVTIVRQHGRFCDFFNFSTHRGNIEANNFYLNDKELFLDFIDNFYQQMEESLDHLEAHTFTLPIGTTFEDYVITTLTTRQQDCAELLCQGLSAKEIGRILRVSPRTVESHINHMIEKFQVKNRIHLVTKLAGQFKLLG